MAQSYLIFAFGSDEEAAEQARIAIDRWKQAFRLDKKVMTRFDRSSEQGSEDGGKQPASAEPAAAAKDRRSKKAAAKKGADDNTVEDNASQEQITLIVRLEFSDHERLSHQRWLTRIPSEEPFKHAHPKVIEPGNPDFAAVAERFQGGAGRPHGFTASNS